MEEAEFDSSEVNDYIKGELFYKRIEDAYKGKDKHCGVCESCMRRKRGFEKAGIKDLTEYEK